MLPLLFSDDWVDSLSLWRINLSLNIWSRVLIMLLDLLNRSLWLRLLPRNLLALSSLVIMITLRSNIILRPLVIILSLTVGTHVAHHTWLKVSSLSTHISLPTHASTLKHHLHHLSHRCKHWVLEDILHHGWYSLG